MENKWLVWQAINDNDRENFIYLVGVIPFTIGLVEVIIYFSLAVLLPLSCIIFDILTSKRHVPRAPIMIDPKGFTTNDLVMLNMKQGKPLAAAKVQECGSINVPAQSAVLLPPTPSKPIKRMIDMQLETAKFNGKEEPVTMLCIEEYRDNTYLASNTEIELATNMEPVRESTEKESASAMLNPPA